MLSQMRTWAPLGDLELTRDALAMQCASVHRKIMLHDPFFKYKGMSSVLGSETRLFDYEQDEGEDGMTDIANTDDLIDNDFELDEGNAAMVVDAEKELSISSSHSSGSPHSPHSGQSDEEMEEMDRHLDSVHAIVSTDSTNSSASSNHQVRHTHSSTMQKHVKVGPFEVSPTLELQLVGSELLFPE
jgi:hypothetical protein